MLLFKSMNSTDLVKKMYSLFPNVFGESASDSDVPLFEYLAADKWNGLNCVEESLLQKHWDGENIRDLAGCGCIYIGPKVKQELTLSVILGVLDMFPDAKFAYGNVSRISRRLLRASSTTAMSGYRLSNSCYITPRVHHK